MRADKTLKYRVYRECVLWQRSEVGMTIMLDAGGQNENWNPNDRFERQCGEGDARRD